MKIHLGLLDEKPYENRSWLWMRRGSWSKTGFPADVYREIAIWLAMPGFEFSYHANALGFDERHLALLYKPMPKYDDLKDEVLDNFASITLEDAVKLFTFRRNKTSGIPLVCQMYMIDEAKKGRSIRKIAKLFGSCPKHTHKIIQRGYAKVVTPLPPEFAMLAVQSRNPVANFKPRP